MLKKYNITISGVTQDGKTCSNPSVALGDHEGVFLNCINGDNYTIQVDEDYNGPNCLQFIVSCDDCATCPPQIITKCLCENTDDCSNCQECIGGICSDTCPDGICSDDNTCVECDNANPCPNNQVCTSGDCQCPPSHPFLLNGVCVQVEDCADCPACTVCRDNNCYPVVCPEGVCNPLTDTCTECSNNSHCGPNEICLEGGTCGCAPGYHLDIFTGLCVVTPECNLNSECPDCQQCVDGVCVPIICPPNQICVDDDCVTSCADGDDCPDGYGCYNGTCVPCNTLDCESPCIFASGCGCVDGDCVDISDDCSVDNVTLSWEYVNPVGTQSESTPGLTGSFTVTNNGVESSNTPPPNGFSSNFSFSYSMNTAGVLGTWYYSPSSGVETVVGTNNTVSVQHGDEFVGNNFLGFRMIFRASDGRNLVYQSTRSGGLQNSNWTTTLISATGIGGSFSGTPGYWTLCSNNPSFTFASLIPTQVQVTSNASSGSQISIQFTENLGSCLVASISGCGDWTGKIKLECLTSQESFDIPVFSVDETSCCAAEDPDCVAGPGEPCVDTTEIVDLILEPFFQEENRFFVYPDLNTISFSQLYSMGTTWTVSPNNTLNDLSISESGLYAITTHTNGGCINFVGTTSCVTYTGEDCLDKCTEFSLYLHEVTSTQYNVVPSYYGTPVVSYSITSGDQFISNSGSHASNANVYVVDLETSNTAPGSIVITGSITGCEDTVEIDINCDTPTVVKQSYLKVGDTITAVYSTTGISDINQFLVTLDGSTITNNNYTFNGNNTLGSLTIVYTSVGLSGTLSLTVEATNECGTVVVNTSPDTAYDYPVAIDDTYEITYAATTCLSPGVLDNDFVETGGSYFVSHAGISVNNQTPLVANAPATYWGNFGLQLTDSCDDLMFYNNDPTYVGDVVFYYTVTSVSSGLTATAKITITIAESCDISLTTTSADAGCVETVDINTVVSLSKSTTIGNQIDAALTVDLVQCSGSSTMITNAIVGHVYIEHYLVPADPIGGRYMESITVLVGSGGVFDVTLPNANSVDCNTYTVCSIPNTCDCLAVPMDYATNTVNRDLWSAYATEAIIQSVTNAGNAPANFDVTVTLNADASIQVLWKVDDGNPDWIAPDPLNSTFTFNKERATAAPLLVQSTTEVVSYPSSCGVTMDVPITFDPITVSSVTRNTYTIDSVNTNSSSIQAIANCSDNTLAVDVTSTCTTLTYQWYIFTNGEYAAIPTATSSTYNIENATGNQYMIEVSCSGVADCTKQAFIAV